MNRSRRNALRLALYLDCIGVKPILSGRSYREYCFALSTQFLSMGAEQRKEARRRGRKRIREAPGLRKAAGHLIPVSSPSAPRSGKWRRNYENYKRKMLLWPSETPPCPVCRMWGGLPKRSWPNWEQAEEIRIRQNDRLLSLFECPVQRGFWHLGHKRSQFGKQ
jgi:hypothetical protein